MTRCKLYPIQLNRLQLHRLKSQPIFPEACLTEWGEPFDFPTGISGFPVKMVSTPGLLQVVSILTSDWLKLCWSNAIHGSYVTCCKTSLPWAGKTRNMYRICCGTKELCSGMLPVTNTDWLHCTPTEVWLIENYLLYLHTVLSVPTSLRTEVEKINQELSKQRWASVLVMLWTFPPQDGFIMFFGL